MKKTTIILIVIFTFTLVAFYHTSAQFGNTKQGTIYDVRMNPFSPEMPNVLIADPMLGIPMMP